MGKRSRQIEARRQLRRFLEHLSHHSFLMDGLKLEFCRMAAAFADCHPREPSGWSSPAAWISINFRLTEAEAATCIALGRHLASLDTKAAKRDARAPIES